MFFPAEADAEDDDDKAEQEYGEIAIFPIQLRHIFEIHAVPACNERQGEKDGGDDGEDFHDFILPDVDLGLVNLPDLRGILPEHERFLMQPSQECRKGLQPPEGQSGSQYRSGRADLLKSRHPGNLRRKSRCRDWAG